MKIQEVEAFLIKCLDAGIDIPRETVIGVSDFEKTVPDAFKAMGICEYSVASGDKMCSVNIISQFRLRLADESFNNHFKALG